MKSFLRERHLFSLFLVVTFSLPFFVQAVDKPTDFKDFVFIIANLALLAVPVVAGLALLAFFYGLAKFILHAGDEKALESGKNIMIWGFIALFVMISIWGIVKFLGDSLGISPSTFGVPQLEEGSGDESWTGEGDWGF